MNHTCKCGGKMISLSDNVAYFRTKCEECGKINTQHKRQKSEKTVLPQSGIEINHSFGHKDKFEWHSVDTNQLENDCN